MSNAQLPPPSASAATLFWLFFSFKGRINREVYWLAILLLLSVLFIVAGLLVAVSGEEAATGPAVLLGIGSMWCEVAILVKRQHDRGLPWFWCVLAFVPIAGAVWMIAAGVIPGDTGPNAYGKDTNEPG